MSYVQPGEVNLKVTVGGTELNSSQGVFVPGLEVVEDILFPFGPVAKITTQDAINTRAQFNGKEDIQMQIESASSIGGNRTFKMQSSKLGDINSARLNPENPNNRVGAGKSDQYSIYGISPEALNAQSNYVQKSWDTQWSNMFKDVCKDNLKTQKEIIVDEETKGNMRYIASRIHANEFFKNLYHQSIATNSKSNLYTIFHTSKNGQESIKLSTWEKLFQQSPVVTLSDRATFLSSSSSEQDKHNTIIRYYPSQLTESNSRGLYGTQPVDYNMTTGRAHYPEEQQTQYTVAGQPVYNSVKTVDQTQTPNRVPARVINDPVNQQSSEYKLAEANAHKKRFLSYLVQNKAIVEVPFNPNIGLGDVINLNIFRKTADNNGDNEQQFDGKALVTKIKTVVTPTGQTPRARMILSVVKAGFKETGGGQG